MLCNGVCVYKTSLSKDRDHCGDCNTKCTDGQSCVQGKCVTTPVTCSSGFELCDGGCKKKDTYASDPLNCGKCNVKVSLSSNSRKKVASLTRYSAPVQPGAARAEFALNAATLPTARLESFVRTTFALHLLSAQMTTSVRGLEKSASLAGA